MHIIIDAYNLLKQLINSNIGERERKRFIDSMKSYAHKKQHSITIVFDGGGYKRPYAEEFDNVTVIYSGFELTADDYIKGLMPRLHPNNALIVTADRAIGAAADNYDIASIDPFEFMRFVHKSVNTNIHVVTHSKDKAKKLAPSTGQESSIDALMEQASNVILDKDQMIQGFQEPYNKKSPKKTVSKIERKLENIVKKL